DLIDGAHPGVQLRPAHGLLSTVAGRSRVTQHLPHRLASQPELLGCLALTHLIDNNCSSHPRIQFHCVHLSGVPQNKTLWECSMDPVFDGLVLLRRTRRSRGVYWSILHPARTLAAWVFDYPGCLRANATVVGPRPRTQSPPYMP